MSDGSIGIPVEIPGGKKLDTTELTVGANTVQRERIQLAGSTALALVEPTNTDPATTAYAQPTRPVANVPDVSASGTISSIASLVTMDLAGRFYVTISFATQDALDATLHVQALNAAGVWDNRFLWDGNRWLGLGILPNGAVSEHGVTFTIAIVPGDQQVKIFPDIYNSGSSDLVIVASNRPPAVFAAGAAGAVFINNSNPTDTDNHALLGLAVGGEDSKSVAGKVVQRVVEVLPQCPTGDEVAFVTRPIPMGFARDIYHFLVVPQVHGAAATIHWDLWNGDASLIVRILSIKQRPSFLTAVTGISYNWTVHRTTDVGTGGSALTAILADLSQTALDADITCRSKPTGGATAGVLQNYVEISSEETDTILQQIHADGGVELVPYLLRPESGGQGLILRPSQGLRVTQVTGSVEGNTGWLIGFSVE